MAREQFQTLTEPTRKRAQKIRPGAVSFGADDGFVV